MDDNEFVTEARARLGLTPEQFGLKLGITRQTVWRYERGDPVPLSVRLATERVLPPKLFEAILRSHRRRLAKRSGARALRKAS